MFKTKFCLFTALLILVSTAQILKGAPTPLGSMGPAPIALQQAQKLDGKQQQMFNKQPNGHPILGGEQFNPTEFYPPIPNQFPMPQSQDPFMPPRPPRPQDKDGHLRHDRMREEHQRRRGRGMQRQGPMRGMPPPPPPIGHEQWERHIEGNHMQGSKFHKRIRCMFIATAVIFTLVGLCLAKCCRKCRKNRNQRIKQIVRRSRTSNEIGEEIRAEEKKLEQLKALYNHKKMQENRLTQLRRQESVRQAYEMQMRQRQISRPQVFYGNEIPSNQGYYNPQMHIPVGRPLNESTNSSFATEYPQI